jgi:hypothetical protein
MRSRPRHRVIHGVSVADWRRRHAAGARCADDVAVAQGGGARHRGDRRGGGRLTVVEASPVNIVVQRLLGRDVEVVPCLAWRLAWRHRRWSWRPWPLHRLARNGRHGPPAREMRTVLAAFVEQDEDG